MDTRAPVGAKKRDFEDLETDLTVGIRPAGQDATGYPMTDCFPVLADTTKHLPSCPRQHSYSISIRGSCISILVRRQKGFLIGQKGDNKLFNWPKRRQKGFFIG